MSQTAHTAQAAPALTLEEARFQANVLWRARRLAAHGYTAEALTEDVVAVRKGDGTEYVVDLFARTCECECWSQRGYCKHLWGAANLIADTTPHEGDGGSEGKER